MNYFDLADLETLIPPQFLTQSLDDDGDGDGEQFDFVRTAAQDAVDAVLSTRYTVPFSGTIPRIVKRAALVFAAKLCYERRGIHDDANPFTSQAADMGKLLMQIAMGKLPLDAATAAASDDAEPLPAGSILTYDSPLGEPTRRLC